MMQPGQGPGTLIHNQLLQQFPPSLPLFHPLPKRTHLVTLFSQGTFPPLTYIDDDISETTSQGPVFNPELVTAHCFRQLKQKDFHLPQSRRRIIIVSGTKDGAQAQPTLPPQPPPPPTPSFKALDFGAIQKPPLNRRAWLNQRAQLRRQLDTFGDVRKWLENKPNITPSEIKVLLMIRQEQKAPKEPLISVRKPKVRSLNGQKLLKASGVCCHCVSLGSRGQGGLPHFPEEQSQVPKGRCMSYLLLHNKYPHSDLKKQVLPDACSCVCGSGLLAPTSWGALSPCHETAVLRTAFDLTRAGRHTASNLFKC